MSLVTGNNTGQLSPRNVHLDWDKIIKLLIPKQCAV